MPGGGKETSTYRIRGPGQGLGGRIRQNPAMRLDPPRFGGDVVDKKDGTFGERVRLHNNKCTTTSSKRVHRRKKENRFCSRILELSGGGEAHIKVSDGQKTPDNHWK